MLAKWLQSCSSLWSYGLQPARLLCPWDSPGKNPGVGCHALLQEIFPTQGSNPCLLHLLHWHVGSLSTTPGNPIRTYIYKKTSKCAQKIRLCCPKTRVASCLESRKKSKGSFLTRCLSPALTEVPSTSYWKRKKKKKPTTSSMQKSNSSSFITW